jgi:hypothetical protein
MWNVSSGRQQFHARSIPAFPRTSTGFAIASAIEGVIAKRGQEIFMDTTLGKCTFCHVNAGAIAIIAGVNRGNGNFNPGIEQLPDQPARLTSELVE